MGWAWFDDRLEIEHAHLLTFEKLVVNSRFIGEIDVQGTFVKAVE